MRWRGVTVAVTVAVLLVGCPSSSSTDAGALEAATCSIPCTAGLTCQAGSCVPESCSTNANCTSPLTCAGGFCTDLSCDPPCSSGTTCLGQVCIPEVPETCGQSVDCGFGLSCVGGYCIDSNCHPACPSTQSCLDGVCVPNGGGACQAPYVLCYDPEGSYCADVQKDSVNCGGCGAVCPSGEVCNGVGTCAVSCVAGESICGNRCVDLQTDSLSCGMCHSACAAGQVCGAGSCATSCASGEASCMQGGTAYCADTTSDPSNCGACGTVCTTFQACSSSLCSVPCGASFTLCGGADAGASFCTDTRFDPANCGVCGLACVPSMVCLDSMCLACGAPGQLCCAGATPCTDGATCTQGVCTGGSLCGNGIVEPGEVCDLGAKNGQGLGCNATCNLVGNVTTLAGRPYDGGQLDGIGVGAEFDQPEGVAVLNGMLYVGDAYERAVRQVDPASGQVLTIAGGDATCRETDGQGSAGTFCDINAIMAYDAGLLIADDSALRYVTPGGDVTTWAGQLAKNGAIATGVDAGAFPSSLFGVPQGLASIGQVVYSASKLDPVILASDPSTQRVSVLTTIQGLPGALAGITMLNGLLYLVIESGTGTLLSVAQDGGYVAVPGGTLDDATGVCTDGQSLYICASRTHLILQYVLATQQMSLVAGGAMGELDGLGADAGFDNPSGCAWDPVAKVLYVTDSVGETLRKIQ